MGIVSIFSSLLEISLCMVYFLKYRMTCRTITASLCLFNHFHIHSYKHMKCITVERNIEPYRERDSVEDMQPRLHSYTADLEWTSHEWGFKGSVHTKIKTTTHFSSYV